MARLSLRGCRKFRAVSRAIGLATARGSLELLWDVANDTADDVLGSADDVEDVAGWRGDRGALVAVLTRERFLDALPGGLYRVHDFWDHCPDYVRRKAKRLRRGPWALSGGESVTDRSVTDRESDSDDVAAEQSSASRVACTQPSPAQGKTEDQDPGLAAGPPPAGQEDAPDHGARGVRLRPPDQANGRVLSLLVSDLLARQAYADDADLKEDAKATCARLGIAYDADQIRRAMDAARAMRARASPPPGPRRSGGFTRVGA